MRAKSVLSTCVVGSVLVCLSAMSMAADIDANFRKDAAPWDIEKAKNATPYPNVPFGTQCDTDGLMTTNYQQLNHFLGSGEGDEAEVLGKILASTSASCGVAFKNAAGAPIATWALFTGGGLLAGLMNNPPKRETDTSKRIRDYLSFAQANGLTSAASALRILDRVTQPGKSGNRSIK